MIRRQRLHVLSRKFTSWEESTQKQFRDLNHNSSERKEVIKRNLIQRYTRWLNKLLRYVWGIWMAKFAGNSLSLMSSVRCRLEMFLLHLHVITNSSFYDYFAECEIKVKWARANSHAWSIGRSILPSLGRKLSFVFLLTNAQLDLTRRKMSNGSANVKHSEAMSDEIITAMWCEHFLIWIVFKKNLESICCPSYEINAGSWQAWVLITWCIQRMNIEQNNKLS